MKAVSEHTAQLPQLQKLQRGELQPADDALVTIQSPTGNTLSQQLGFAFTRTQYKIHAYFIFYKLMPAKLSSPRKWLFQVPAALKFYLIYRSLSYLLQESSRGGGSLIYLIQEGRA